MQSDLLLQRQRASGCTYHTVKSHPVPHGHVTFTNATVNDSTVHDESLKERDEFGIFCIITIYVLKQHGIVC